ncbi:TPA: ead/Ea22-like family protein [Escherichia coli]|uniref:ead/Ea22-like family protein n=1 Tax=Escherichia coli TaxID=562 RepID=UPI000BE32DB2|nr:ead/Ea22-like family protein [Escherichia coli]EFN6653999.1 ead/Ea22-like family protein [Escherichia coli O166:H6]EFN6739524.1 ead/Ea22-like family protein [Escherichia coli H6]EEZ4406352.1 ead/Ea22-like family protein [Escherichia coli]EFO1353138.1 ead/Ea22-like family protein [Escherichia coli]MBB7542265.1 ead/Ea22-like family protein [Escherichia coli]
MSKIDYQALREAAQNAKNLGGIKNYKRGEQAVAEFKSLITPHIVLALLEERERNQQYIKRRDQENEDIALTVGKLRVELEAVQKTSAARIEAIDRTHKMFQREKDRADAAEKCIAELSASHSKLRDTMAGIHNTIRMDGGYTPLAAILNAAKRAYEESASAAGIRIKGE